MVERILLVLKVKNLSPSKFADEIGVQRSSMSHIMSGRNLPSLDLVTKIMNRFPDINPEWLLMGIGQMIKTTQIDLFDQNISSIENKIESASEPEIETIIEDKKESLSEKAAENVLQSSEMANKSSQKEEIKQDNSANIIIPSQMEIEKIVILYKNKSFKEYYPSL